MKSVIFISDRKLIAAAVVVASWFSIPARAQTIVSRTADVGGVKLQYLTAGRGPAILLLHGYAETSRMWRPLIPKLAASSTVIAPDLPGIGDSDIPSDGLDMTHAAARIHELVRRLGVEKASVVGHDIGLIVTSGNPDATKSTAIDRVECRTAIEVGLWDDRMFDPLRFFLIACCLGAIERGSTHAWTRTALAARSVP